MNKPKSAAGLRHSAVAERIRLREEWSALKGEVQRKQAVHKNTKRARLRPINRQTDEEIDEVLRGVVALVEVGTETKALPLRAALAALGATVVPKWQPLVTHLIWTQGGCRLTRAKARALASRLVSPLWVEACAATGSRLPEHAFPAAARASDLPSPRTLRQMLKKAEMENIPLADLLSNSKDDKDPKVMMLRISSDASANTSSDKSRDTSRDSSGVPSRAKTEPRAATAVVTPRPKLRRKLFTQREAETRASEDDSDAERCRAMKSVTPRERRGLARAERAARRLAAITTANTARPCTGTSGPRTPSHYIVLTGMPRNERRTVSSAIRQLKGRVQGHVNRKTTHVLLGSCREERADTSKENLPCSSNVCPDAEIARGFDISGIEPCSNDGGLRECVNAAIARCETRKARTFNALAGAARGCRVLYAQWAIDSLKNEKWLHHIGYEVAHLRKISQKARIERAVLGRMRSEYAYNVFSGMRVRISPSAEQREAAMQLLSLCGAVVHDAKGGSRPADSDARFLQNGVLKENGRNQPAGSNARCLQKGINTQNGVCATQHGVRTQDGVNKSADFDMTIGTRNGEVNSKWVFDSVAAGRMRTVRRYVNNVSFNRDLIETQVTVI